MKLLLAEDTTDLNRAVSAAMEHFGYEVDSFFDGEAALEAVKKNVYDAVILDIMMPKLDGISVLKEIRRSGILTPVLLLTAKTEIDDRVEGLDAGADDYLPKPFAMKELLARVRSMTRRKDEYQQTEMIFFDLSLDADNSKLSANNTISLSIHEFELMKVLMLNTERSLETAYLLEHIWKNQTDADADTVWLYISYLRGKLRSIGTKAEITGEKGGSFQLVMP